MRTLVMLCVYTCTLDTDTWMFSLHTHKNAHKHIHVYINTYIYINTYARTGLQEALGHVVAYAGSRMSLSFNASVNWCLSSGDSSFLFSGAATDPRYVCAGVCIYVCEDVYICMSFIFPSALQLTQGMCVCVCVYVCMDVSKCICSVVNVSSMTDSRYVCVCVCVCVCMSVLVFSSSVAPFL
jgi:hypothetical protein